MAKAKIPRPSKHLRDEARRDEIIDAARKCVAKRGFHAASMAEIAESAGMSVGQIYRYFANKEAIIHAIVEKIMARRMEWMEKDNTEPDLPTVMMRRMLVDDEEQGREERILMIEVIAEASRNPAVRKIFLQADRRARKSIIESLRGRSAKFNEENAEGFINIVSAMFEGNALFRNMGLRRDDDVTRMLYRKVLDVLCGDLNVMTSSISQ